LKVLPFALTLDPKQLQRFKNESAIITLRVMIALDTVIPAARLGAYRSLSRLSASFASSVRRASGAPSARARKTARASLVPM